MVRENKTEAPVLEVLPQRHVSTLSSMLTPLRSLIKMNVRVVENLVCFPHY